MSYLLHTFHAPQLSDLLGLLSLFSKPKRSTITTPKLTPDQAKVTKVSYLDSMFHPDILPDTANIGELYLWLHARFDELPSNLTTINLAQGLVDAWLNLHTDLPTLFGTVDSIHVSISKNNHFLFDIWLKNLPIKLRLYPSNLSNFLETP